MAQYLLAAIGRRHFQFSSAIFSRSSDALQGPAREQKMFRDRTGTTLFRAGTVPIPVPVLSLSTTVLSTNIYTLMKIKLTDKAMHHLCRYTMTL